MNEKSIANLDISEDN